MSYRLPARQQHDGVYLPRMHSIRREDASHVGANPSDQQISSAGYMCVWDSMSSLARNPTRE